MTDAPPKLTAAEIAIEISRTRARLSRGLAVLDRDYALRHLIVRTVRFVRHPAGNAAAIKEALSRDVVPLSLIGIGLGWLSFAGSRTGGDLLGRLMGALRSLEQLARDTGLLQQRVEPDAPPAPLAIPGGEPADSTH
jgi:hypothetical protein